jgi:endonuclease-3
VANWVTPDYIIARLRNRFDVPSPPGKKPPLDELIRTILSQNTNDLNRDRAFTVLKDRCPRWQDVLTLSTDELARIIAPAGLGPTKSRRIQDLLESIYSNGREGLPDLCSMDPEEATAYLTNFKGVGPKTASCVLLFSCGIPAFPVDTHIYRVTGRLGLLPKGADRVRAHEVLGKLFEPRYYLELHLNLIRLGREVCRPRKPACDICPLKKRCPSSDEAKKEPSAV